MINLLNIKTMAIATVFILTSSCQTTKVKKSNTTVVKKDTPAQEKYSEDNKPEDGPTLTSCIKSKWPELSLTLGVCIAAAPAVIPALIYYGGAIYQCSSEKKPIVTLSQQIDEELRIRQQASIEEIKKDFQQVYEKLQSKTNVTLEYINTVREKIESLSKSEQDKLQALTDNLLLEIYKEIEVFRESKIIIKSN